MLDFPPTHLCTRQAAGKLLLALLDTTWPDCSLTKLNLISRKRRQLAAVEDELGQLFSLGLGRVSKPVGFSRDGTGWQRNDEEQDEDGGGSEDEEEWVGRRKLSEMVAV